MRISSRISSCQKMECRFFPFLFLFPADGIFGRCQRVPVIDVYKYDISPPVLQRLRIILEKLSHRGTVKTPERGQLRWGLQLFCAPSEVTSLEVFLTPGNTDLIKSKEPSDSLNLQQGLCEAISGEVPPPYVVPVCG